LIDLGLHQRVVLITNATSHAGQALAGAYAAQGAWIAVHFFSDAHGAKNLVDTIRSEGGRALLAPGSIHDHEGAWSLIERIEMEWQQVDVLVHTTSLDENRHTPLDLMKEVYSRMAQHGWGRILTFNSSSVFSPSSTHVLINNIALNETTIIEPAMKLALFLGSNWNQCVSGQSFSVAENQGHKESR
jgi:NAD(P)-dependent dehydrogenase (short-subunit alcohol dehydrogenase family)